MISFFFWWLIFEVEDLVGFNVVVGEGEDYYVC